ncbi:spermatogenesis associated 1 [Nothobranchius furzeri]|uniref:Spermatogenesis associated 1 n=2 Tax=Nothobranchius furzeri TaxID=105023 RepID=A0A9D3BA89_NOTFU|nr:spermatogenesis associated 1 [Nothobranchius furzeri]
MRPASCKFVELHVLFVPCDQWNVKLNKISAKATESFISAGFIRVYPDITLRTLRAELAAFLGGEKDVNKFSFLRCVGQSLAVVKSSQEKDLKVKTFAPPYAAQPELYLLPAVEADSSFCSRSVTTDTSSSSPEQQICYQPLKLCDVPTGTKKPVKFPHIPPCSQQLPPPSELEEEGEEEEEEDDRSCSSSEGEVEEEALCCMRRTEQEDHTVKPQSHRALQLVSMKKALDRCEAAAAQVRWLPHREETCSKTKHRDGLSADCLEGQDPGVSLRDRNSKDVHALTSLRNKPTAGVCGGLDSVKPASPVTNREELIETLKLVKEERRELEWTRQQLLRKGKDLLSQNRHRRNQARDSWKKKYFGTKKATAPLEDKLRQLKLELETLYNKALHQLQIRKSLGKPLRQGRTSGKNELIIQIMKENFEIDNMKRKVEDAEMKLITEMKLRKQAATELGALKVELAQKRSQSSHPGLTGNTAREKMQVSSTTSLLGSNSVAHV